jgi:hypothetical protein
MLRQCAWCRRSLGRAEPLDDDRVTRGIWPGCGVRMVEDYWRAEAAGGRGLLSDEAIAAARQEFAGALERCCAAVASPPSLGSAEPC